MVYRFLFLLTGFAVLPPTCAVGAEGAKDAAKKLQGKWTVVTSRAQMFKGHEVIFAGDKMTIRDSKGRELTCIIKVDPSQQPPTIEMTVPRRGTFKGIYKLKGDTLTILMGPRDHRPTGFDCNKGTERTELKRKKGGKK